MLTDCPYKKFVEFANEILFKFILAEISKQRGFYSEYINLSSDIIIATQNKNEAIKILKNDNSFFHQNSKLKLFELTSLPK